MKVKSLSCVQLLATPWTAAYQAPLSMGFSRQEYWSGVPLPSPLGYFYVSAVVNSAASSTVNIQGWIHNRALLYSAGNYSQYPVISHNRKDYLKKNICMCMTE